MNGIVKKRGKKRNGALYHFWDVPLMVVLVFFHDCYYSIVCLYGCKGWEESFRKFKMKVKSRKMFKL